MSYKKIKINGTFIEEAINEAKKSVVTIKHGCVIVRRNKIIARGHNKYETRKKFQKYYSIHAELDAIFSCKDKYLKNCIIFVIRLRSDGTIAYSKPCEKCQKVLKKKGFKKIYHS